jgi:hypothetical protein
VPPGQGTLGSPFEVSTLIVDMQLPQDASTETRLIAAMVFSTLNESWDKFKEQNGL